MNKNFTFDDRRTIIRWRKHSSKNSIYIFINYAQKLSNTLGVTHSLCSYQVKEKKPHIKKPLNAFMLFMKEKRAEVIKECTLKESAAINQILGKKVRVRGSAWRYSSPMNKALYIFTPLISPFPMSSFTPASGMP